MQVRTANLLHERKLSFQGGRMGDVHVPPFGDNPKAPEPHILEGAGNLASSYKQGPKSVLSPL